MKRTRIGLFIGAMLAMTWPWMFTNAARAADAPIELKERAIFYLDWGFVGRPVSLDLNGGKTVVRWEAGDLVAPTVLMVEIEKEPSSSATANVTFGEEVVHLTWADPYNLSARGVAITNQDGCTPGPWSVCALYVQHGDAWKESVDGRAYGHVRVRMGTKQGTYMQTGSASWYKYKNCRCAASPDFPKGTRVRVRSRLTGKYTVVRINDFGPERDKFPDRAIDLDAVAFKELAPLGAGTIGVTVEPLLPSDPEYAMADQMPATVATQTTTKTTSASQTTAWSY